MLSGGEIRDRFLHYFEEKGHLVVPSSSLVPTNDPTLLLTSAGVNQMKSYLLGEALEVGRARHRLMYSLRSAFLL